jgi:hypothetical protein
MTARIKNTPILKLVETVLIRAVFLLQNHVKYILGRYCLKPNSTTTRIETISLILGNKKNINFDSMAIFKENKTT